MAPTTALILGPSSDPALKTLNDPDLRAIFVKDATDADYASAEVALLWGWDRSEFIEVLQRAPSLRWAHYSWAGVEKLSSPPLPLGNCTLTNSAGVYAKPLAEWVLGAMLYFTKDFKRLLEQQQQRRWEQFEVAELRSKSVCIVGFGGIGKAIADRCLAFEMQVAGVSRRGEAYPGVKVYQTTELDRALHGADYLVLSTPLTDSTRGMIALPQLTALAKGAIVVNVGRGPVLDESALLTALSSGHLSGAALDVFDVEPLPSEHPLYSLDTVLLSPHSADHTPTWRLEAVSFFLQNLRRYRAGQELRNVVDLTAGY